MHFPLALHRMVKAQAVGVKPLPEANASNFITSVFRIKSYVQNISPGFANLYFSTRKQAQTPWKSVSDTSQTHNTHQGTKHAACAAVPIHAGTTPMVFRDYETGTTTARQNMFRCSLNRKESSNSALTSLLQNTSTARES